MTMKRGQGFDATIPHFYEASLNRADYLEVWCYTDQLSYEVGEEVQLHLNTTAADISLGIYRDGAHAKWVYQTEGIPGQHFQTPENSYAEGCGWPAGHRWKIPENLPSGFYLVICKVRNETGEEREHEAGFFVRPKAGQPASKLLLIAATSTWTAYNDWGGANSYAGPCRGYVGGKSPHLSTQRPWAKGFLRIPEGAPRKPHEYSSRPGDIPRYPPIEFAYTRGYSKYYANAGWASYERPFAQWAESSGYELDYATQTDLHYRPELIDPYKCVVIVGHDEYWTREMRLAIDSYVEKGGCLARFGGNFFWQVRLEDEGRRQVAYKEDAAQCDPVANTDQRHLLTSCWEDPKVGWSGARTVGLNGCYGIYAGVGHIAPKQGGGFSVYRPEHWIFDGTDLCYGDQFGTEARIFGYEVDGLDYLIRHGLPEPTYIDGAIDGTQILAMGLAGNLEANHQNQGTIRYYAGEDLLGVIAGYRYGEVTEETKAAASRGNGMIIHVHSGRGQLVNAGSCEWVAGLKQNDEYTQRITRNVLDRFTG